MAARAASDSALAASRVCAEGAGRRALLQAQRAEEEHVSSERLEEQCACLAEACRAEDVRCRRTLERLAAEEREVVQQECEEAELQRRLRQVEADGRVSLEDLRIAQQRALLAHNEEHTLEQD